MRSTAIVCSVLAGTLGFSSLAVAQDRGDRREARQERREARQELRQDRREFRQERRQDRREFQARQQDRQENRAFRQGYRAGAYSQPRYVYSQPRYVYTQPSYGYSAPRYYNSTPRYYRGGYLPHEYRNHGYYVSNWNAYPSLYAPPYGHQWVNVGGDFLLVALATGLIAHALSN